MTQRNYRMSFTCKKVWIWAVYCFHSSILGGLKQKQSWDICPCTLFLCFIFQVYLRVWVVGMWWIKAWLCWESFEGGSGETVCIVLVWFFIITIEIVEVKASFQIFRPLFLCQYFIVSSLVWHSLCRMTLFFSVCSNNLQFKN